uniref:Ig-like domain-containing protein n=1 Tax=Takifugu rubripes TaxID=31033 RepID=A0A674MAF8_TAKRU
ALSFWRFIPISSETNFILVKPGQNLTLLCLQKDNVSPMINWFKQTLGEKPRLICTYRISSEDWKFVNDFKTNPRFQIHAGNKGANLTISDLELSDSATYYCVNQYVKVFDFTEGYKVIVEGSGLTIDHSSQSIQAGGSVTLNCTVHTGWTCDGDHTVYWFRNSGPSQLGLMYNDTGGNKQCERKTNTCFYSFSMKNLNTSQTGTYYCAVAACGHILFGNGNKLLLKCYFMCRLFPYACKNAKANMTSVANQSNRSRKQKNRQNECVYSTVRS